MAPESVSVPVPALARPRVPEPLLITPLKVVLVLSAPTVSTFAPELELDTVPAPDRAPMVSLALTLYVAPLATVSAVLSDRLPDTSKVPWLTVVVPV